MISAVHPAFDSKAFVADCLDGYEALELKDRGIHIAAAMKTHLPDDPAEGMRILVDSLGPEIPDPEVSQGMAPFLYWPHTVYVAENGLGHLNESFAAQKELTKRFSAEFSIRAFIQDHEEKTLAQLRKWAKDPSVHVRRLVSEGTRPRLPWGGNLKKFQVDPKPVLDLLELLKDDSEEYVRRSVANNLNDIAKDHPDVVVGVAKRWWPDADRNGKRLIRHGLRTLVKQGHPEALRVLGYDPDTSAEVTKVSIEPGSMRIGEKVRIEVELTNATDRVVGVLLDLRLHFVKANGSSNPKVFKGAEHQIQPRQSVLTGKTISVKQHTTRTHYPGTHRVDVVINGAVQEIGSFELEP